MLIELAAVRDAEEILRLQKLAFRSEAVFYNDFTIPPLVQTLDGMLADVKTKIVLKLTVDGIIIGSVRGYVKDKTGYVGRLMVHPQFQNQGIGSQLMQAVEEKLKSAQAERYELFTGDRSERTIRLYQKLGYHIFRQQPEHDHAVVFMEKPAG
jgi:ribosomal protein S18 acetylase RimI-like enzyme